jgi:type III secretion apparatus needle protein
VVGLINPNLGPTPTPTSGSKGSVNSYSEAYEMMDARFKDAIATLQKEMEDLKADDPQYLFKMSKAMTKWSLAIQTQSQLLKEMSDALKGIIQKM